jgi:superfamily I DNA/RNA helicase
MIWVRQRPDGYAQLAGKVAQLLLQYPMIGRAVAKRYPIVICDEHQDSNADQHAMAMSLYDNGARLRVFADPMQKIFREANPFSWNGLVGSSHRVDELDHPHRWMAGCLELGKWTLKAREALKNGGKVDLRTAPPSVKIVKATNIAQKNFDYRVGRDDRRLIDAFEKKQSSLLVLTRYNKTAGALRSFFDRRILLWEGYTRSALDTFVAQLDGATGPEEIARAIMKFMDAVAVGFSPSEFGKRLADEIAEGCSKRTRGKPAMIQELAKLVLQSPDHKGAARMLARLHEFAHSEPHFTNVKFDCHREFWDAVRLGQFENPADGLADMAYRRAYARSQPPDRAISTIHKAKGLECQSVIVVPCDGKSFPNKPDARCLLYVALSRAKSDLMLVISADNLSPLFIY